MMSYGQVMLEASIAPISAEEHQTEYLAQQKAMKDWAVVNGMGFPSDDVAMKAVSIAFNDQIYALKAASEAQTLEMPDIKKEALAELKKAFANMAPSLFEKKCITLANTHIDFPGPYSLLELYMRDWPVLGTPGTYGGITRNSASDSNKWVSTSTQLGDLDAMLATIKTLPLMSTRFQLAFAPYADEINKSTATQVKHLISQLPIEDRKNFEFGKLTLAKQTQHEYWAYSQTEKSSTTVSQGHSLLVKTELKGKVNLYEIDIKQNKIIAREDLGNIQTGSTPGQRPSTTFREVIPSGTYGAHITDEAKDDSTIPKSFTSERTAYIAAAMQKEVDIEGFKASAKGLTTFETEHPFYKKAVEFMLNLIPLRSAIKNFKEGNHGEGIVDLTLDIFGFLVGASAAAKGAKALQAGAQVLTKAAHGVKILGRAAVGSLNPLGGVDDLFRGAVLGVRNGVRYVRGTALLKVANKPDIAEGVYKATGRMDEIKTLAKLDDKTGHWHAYNPRTQQAYGKPLENFKVDSTGSDWVVKNASREHGLAATGTYTLGSETVEGRAVLFQGNWHPYDVVKKKPFGKPLTDFKPNHVAANGEIRALDANLVGYEAKHISQSALKVKGLQANVYVGPGKKEYVKIDAKLYESSVKDGQRFIRHPAHSSPDLPLSDQGAGGWTLASSADRLLGGGGRRVTPWQLDAKTYVVPMDDIKFASGSAHPYTLDYYSAQYSVSFDSLAGAWKSNGLTKAANVNDSSYFWRSSKGTWQKGTLAELKQAKQIDAHQFKFVDISPPTILSVPKDARPLPKDLHYFWAGQDIPDKLIKNIANNASKTPGYKSIIHVHADNPAILQKISSKVEAQAPGVIVKDFQQDALLKELKNTGMYDYFREGQGKNLAAASDVARYPIMQKYGGFYFDTDDVIKGSVGSTPLKAGADDILLNRPAMHAATNYKPFYNNSNFATQPGNPVMGDIITEMKKRFVENRPYFLANRPTTSRGADGLIQHTEAFKTYERKIFETTGPSLLNDTLKKHRPNTYDLGFDGLSKDTKIVEGKVVSQGPVISIEQEARRYYLNQGIVPPDLLPQHIAAVKEHYQPLSRTWKVHIGSEQSWIDT